MSNKTGVVREATVSGGIKLAVERADAVRWLAWVWGHCAIVHPSPGGSAMTCGVGRSPVCGGSIPRVMVGLRHTVIGRRRRAG
jgi:hypothetical protein